MAEKKKKVASIVLNEVPASDESVDYEIVIEGAYGGIEVKFDTTFDKVRDFFTERRERKEALLEE